MDAQSWPIRAALWPFKLGLFGPLTEFGQASLPIGLTWNHFKFDLHSISAEVAAIWMKLFQGSSMYRL